MTIEELAEEYGTRLSNAVNKKAETDRIILEINNLQYSNTDEKLSIETKTQLIKAIKNYISKYIVEKFANDQYIDLVNYMLIQVGGK